MKPRFPRVSETVLVPAAAVLGSLLFLLLGPYSNYASTGLLDPWFYTGYFTNFGYLLRHVGPTYFVSRLPWILPGVAAFRVAPPEAASVALNLAIVAASAVSLYWIVRWHYGRTAAIASAALLATSPFLMCTAGWDYPDGPAIAYSFAALAFAVRPHGRRAVNCATAGGFLGLAGLTQMAGGPMYLGLVAVLLYQSRGSARGMVRDGLLMCAGAASVTAALCPVSQLLFGKWTYFYWQVHKTLAAMVEDRGSLERLWGSGPGFLLRAYRLFAPALLLALGPFVLARRGKAKVAWAAYLGLSVCLALYAFQDFVLHGAALRVQTVSSYLVVPLFFLVGTVMGECGISRKGAAAVVGLAVMLPVTHRYWTLAAGPWLWLFAAGAACAAAYFIGRFAQFAALLAAVLFVAPVAETSCSFMWDDPVALHGRNVEAFRNLLSLQRSIQSAVHPDRWVRFWYDNDEPPSAFYNSADSLYLWLHEDFSPGSPVWNDAGALRRVLAGATLVHLTVYPERLADRERLLASHGYFTTNPRRWTMPYGGFTLHILLEDVDASGGSPGR